MSKSDLQIKLIVAQEQNNFEEFYELIKQIIPGKFCTTSTGFKIVENDFEQYTLKLFDNSAFEVPADEHDVETPDIHTIAQLSEFLAIDEIQIIKAVFFNF